MRARHDAASGKLRIELNGKVIGTVGDVGQMKKPALLRGTYESLVSIWTKNVAQDCSSFVLVLIPMAEGGSPQVRPGFGACNSSARQFSMNRGGWETWWSIAFREDSPKASVAVARDGKLAVTEHTARPCLFAKAGQDDRRCMNEYVAAAYGSVERGTPSGDERAGGHRLATFENVSKTAGSIEIDGKPYKTLANVKALHAESSIAMNGSVLFSVWVEPADNACGYRMLLRIAADGKESQTLDRVGVCRQKSANVVARSRDGVVTGWTKIMLRQGDRQIDIASWSGGEVALRTIEADACVLAPTVTDDCIKRISPGGAAGPAPGAAGPGASTAAPAQTAPWLKSTSVHPAVQKGFKLLAENQVDTAIAEFDRALIAEPNNALAYAGRGYSLTLKGKFDNALTDLDRAAQLAPRAAAVYTFRGFLFLLRSEPDRAITQLD